MGYLLLGSLSNLLWLGFWGLMLYAVWVFVRNSVPAFKGLGPEDLSPVSLVLTILLILAVIFLFEQIWKDAGRLAGEQSRYGYDASIELTRLIYRSIFVGPVSFIALFLYFTLRGKGTRYGVLTLPYFITSLIFLVRLLFNAGRFVLHEYEVLGIYIVLIFIIVIISGLIFFIQKQYEAYKKQESRIQNKVNEYEKKDGQKDSFPQI